MQSFDRPSDETPYLNWLRDNSSGFVINTNSGNPTANATRLHSASCYSISKPRPGFERFTGGDYRKLCATDRRELEAWARTNCDFPLQACRHCLG